jgi:hypothetical protein
MICWRVDLQKKMAQYVHGNLQSEAILAIEGHLAECESCRNRLARVQEGSRLAAELKRVQAPQDSWIAIKKRIRTGIAFKRTEEGRWLRALVTLAAGTLALFILFLVRDAFFTAKQFDREAFREVPLSRFDATAEPHVATEGYVSEVHVDEEDGDMMFKLVDNLHEPNHFVVCEIIPNMKLDLPLAGSRIRVYGVSRYDGQPDHQWYEVHPVLNIEPVN